MKTIIKKSLQSLLLVPILALGVSAVVPVLQPTEAYAQETSNRGIDIEEGIEGGIDATGVEDQGGISDIGQLIETITNILLFIVGAIAVIMIIYGGFKYITSAGDSSSVTSAKNTILYAVIGLIIALLAYAIVRFVVDRLQ